MVRRLVIAAILAISLGAPVVEMFDQWDHTFQDGNDTEANAVIAALCVGIAIVIGTLVVARIRAVASSFRVCSFLAARCISSAITSSGSSVPAISPPTLLRV